MPGTAVPAVMIRYTVTRDRVEGHLKLLRAAYEELDAIRPDGLRWATFQLDDGVRFVDFVSGDSPPRLLSQLPAFQRYRATLDERCDEPPVLTVLHEVGSFRFH